MHVSSTVKRIGVIAIFIAELAVMAAIAYGAGDLPEDSVMVGADDVVIRVEDQKVFGAVSIERVLTPVDGWVILRADRGDGIPGELIGAAAVSAGENRNVGVVMDLTLGYPVGVFVSLLADNGGIGEFEYTTDDPDDSVSPDGGGGMAEMAGSAGGAAMSDVIDKPLVADGEVVAEYLRITPVNVVYQMIEADLGSAYLVESGTVVNVRRVAAPGDSWVVIVRGSTTEYEGELVGKSEVVGSVFVPGGRAADLRIQLSEEFEASELTALLLADFGMPGVLETDAESPARGPDAPYLVMSYYVQIPVLPGE